ncbi:hypothetical protein [Lederbergia galactosidilytica]|uniref:Secreted protein n=1 Tax=Lederbergia galactosidilytica TaxID=217031 RepID=A0A177ZTJ8_9BACI|nr:hypothetical protein [Lederbergia galactosidilytica]MBP1916332.1 hypothetical protein [Lederbergia galactosidilytica]OAK70660.1 hypothetical protein ABB05_11795 [Lederbergia galactosidilytica]
MEHKDYKSSHHNHHIDHHNMKNEVNILISYEGNLLTIDLKDQSGNTPEFELNHEKIFHLIIVSSDLQQYYHLHPVDKGNGIFQQEISLKEDLYKVFVDVNPKNLDYQISPIDLHVGHAHHDKQVAIQPDTHFQKTVDNITVELQIDSLVIHKPTTFTYNITGGKLEPYLGALGHVIIVDKDLKQFIHVHPVADDKTIFHTQFTKPGIYKVWSEFKFGENVQIFPFVIQVS